MPPVVAHEISDVRPPSAYINGLDGGGGGPYQNGTPSNRNRGDRPTTPPPREWKTPGGTLVRPKNMTLANPDEHARSMSPSHQQGHCVDEICTCTRHRCPKPWRPNKIKFDGTTMYKDTYTEKPLPPVPRYKAPEYTPSPYKTKLLDETTHKADFREWELPPTSPQMRGPPDGAVDRPKIPFNGESSYHAEFHEKPLPPQMSRTAIEWRPSPVKFDAETTNRVYHDHKPLPKPTEMPSPVDRDRGRERLPFQGETEYRADFKEWPLPKRDFGLSGSPKVVPIPDHRDFTSEQRLQYTPKEVPHQPPRQELTWTPSPLKFDGTSHYKDQYVRKPIEKQPPMSPVRVPEGPRLKFDGTTTNHSDYQKWDLPKPDPNQLRPSTTPHKSLPFDGNTCYRTDYEKVPLPAQEKRPPIEWKPNPLPFDADTTYRINYDEKPLEKPSPADRRVPADYGRYPKVPFEGTTSYKSNYKEWELPRHDPHAQAGSGITYQPVPDNRDFSSNYRTNYTGEPLPVCPITLLPPYPHNPPDDTREHVFYDVVTNQWY